MSALANTVWRIYRSLALLLRDLPILNWRVGKRSWRDILATASWKALRRTVPNPMKVDGIKLYHSYEMASAVPMASGTYEHETARLVRDLLREGDTFVDVGAHIGYYTLLAARAVGRRGHVYAFEPAPENLQLLRRNVLENGYASEVRIVAMAASDCCGERVLFLSDEDSGRNSLFWPNARGVRKAKVDVITLDAFFEREGWPKVHFVKIDVEGGEVAALRGMRTLSERNPSLKLIVEFNPGNLTRAGTGLLDLMETMSAVGFSRVFAIAQPLMQVRTLEEILRSSPRVSHYVNLLCER